MTADVALTALAGSEAEVLLDVGPGKRGKVRARVGGQWVDFLAETGDSSVIERKDKVLIVSVNDGVAQVTRLRRVGGQASDQSEPLGPREQLESGATWKT